VAEICNEAQQQCHKIRPFNGINMPKYVCWPSSTRICWATFQRSPTSVAALRKGRKGDKTRMKKEANGKKKKSKRGKSEDKREL